MFRQTSTSHFSTLPPQYTDSYRYGFNGKEKDDEIVGSGNSYDYGMRIYDPRVGRFLSTDPLTRDYPQLTPYQFASNTPIMAIDLDGEEAYVVVFPDYKISTPLGKIGGLGHAGSLIIDPRSGDAYYVEYGRYDKENKGITRTVAAGHKIGTVKFDKDGLPTTESLSAIFGILSEQAGKGGRIETAEVKITGEEFDKMLQTQKDMLKQNEDPNRKKYDLQSHNCGTVACDVITENKENSGIPDDPNARPVKMVQEAQKGTTRVAYDPKSKATTRGGTYQKSKDEEDTDRKIPPTGTGTGNN